MEDLNLKLQGMNCASCANSIEKAILNVPGVVEGNVNFNIDRATIRYDPQQTNLNIITKAVTDIGYEAQVSPQISHLKTTPKLADNNVKSEIFSIGFSSGQSLASC